MNPQLVDYDIFFKKKHINNKQPYTLKDIDNKYLLNILSLLLITIGIIYLFNRKRNKIENKKAYTQNIFNLFHKIFSKEG